MEKLLSFLMNSKMWQLSFLHFCLNSLGQRIREIDFVLTWHMSLGWMKQCIHIPRHNLEKSCGLNKTSATQNSPLSCCYFSQHDTKTLHFHQVFCSFAVYLQHMKQPVFTTLPDLAMICPNAFVIRSNSEKLHELHFSLL